MSNLVLRPMQEADIPGALDVYREAFRAFLNVPDNLIPDSDYVESRFRSYPEGAIIAEIKGAIVGTSFISRWGSLAVLGPSTVKPTGWTGGAGKKMLERSVEILGSWGVRGAGGYTFSQSVKHIDFFYRVGIHPRFLTVTMAKSPRPQPEAPTPRVFSEFDAAQREGAMAAADGLCSELYEGLSLREEMLAVQRLGIGETLFCFNGDVLESFAVCHIGLGSEAGSNTLHVKFGAVRPGADSLRRFDALLSMVESFAAARKLPKMTLGINLAHFEGYRRILERQYMPILQGVAIHWRNEPLYKRPEFFVIDDWR